MKDNFFIKGEFDSEKKYLDFTTYSHFQKGKIVYYSVGFTEPAWFFCSELAKVSRGGFVNQAQNFNAVFFKTNTVIYHS